MLSHTAYRRVLYAETDKMGYLYHGHYITYYEVGRVELFRSIGLSYKDMEDRLGIIMPVMSLQSRFLRPATYDERIAIKTEMRKMPESDVTIHCELFNENDQLINQGSVKLCFINAQSLERVEAPSAWLNPIKPYFD